ncbi:S-adenosylmethionine:tRNA ribosyltransferase-isomerase [Streptomyces sp. L7]
MRVPSAARPFTARMVAELVSRGVQFAPITLHTGVASAEVHEPPYPERFAVSDGGVGPVDHTRRGPWDGRVIAVGTTAVRAVESAAGGDGVVTRVRGGRISSSPRSGGAGGGRAADGAARTGGLASADAGGGRRAGRSRPQLGGGAARALPVARVRGRAPHPPGGGPSHRACCVSNCE